MRWNVGSLQKAYALAAQTGCPVLIEGPPGCGKTAWSEAAFGPNGALGGHVETVIASIREPQDFGGIQVPDLSNPDDPRVLRIAERWAKDLCAVAKKGKRPVLFVDEIRACPPAVQKALLRVTFGGFVGDTKLPDNLIIIAAANPAAMNGYDLDAPLANRFIHLKWSFPLEEWAEGAISGFPVPEIPVLPGTWKSEIPLARTLVVSFVKARPQFDGEGAVPKDESEQGGAWPSRRTWEMVWKVLAACRATGMDGKDSAGNPLGLDVQGPLVAGCVGEAAGMEFMAFKRDLDLPDPAVVLKDPASLVLPNRDDRIYAVLASITTYAIQHGGKENWNGAWQVMAKAYDAGVQDITAQAARALCRAMAKGAPFHGMTPPLDAAKFAPLLTKAGLMGTTKGGK